MVKWSFFKRPGVLKKEELQADLSAVAEKQAFSFPLVFSQSVKRKKSIGMGLSTNGALEIRFPIWMASSDMAVFIQEKKAWIQKRGTLLIGSKTPNPFEKGRQIPFLGKNYPFKISLGGRSNVSLKEGLLTVNLSKIFSGEKEKKGLKKHLGNWYREQARFRIDHWVKIYSEKMNLAPKQIRYKKMRSQWGSCSSRGNLNFNWLLVCCPERAIEYVVVHELCHLKVMGHGPGFWKLVARFFPDYKKQQGWFRANGHGVLCLFSE